MIKGERSFFQNSSSIERFLGAGNNPFPHVRQRFLTVLFLICTILTSTCKAFTLPDKAIADSNPASEAETVPYPEVAGELRALMAAEDHVSDYSLSSGNSVQLLVDGPMTFEAMFAAIEKATHHIHAETFIIDHDRIGRKFAEKLIERTAAGVEVRLIIDAVGGLGADEAFLEQLRDNNIKLYKFHPVDPVEDWRIWRINSRHHRKILVVDGKIAFTGGVNISQVYSGSSFSPSRQEKGMKKGWRDTHVKITGPAVAQLQDLFIDLWNENEELSIPKTKDYFPRLEKSGNDYVRVIDSTSDNSETEIYEVYMAAIRNAQQNIWITQGYFSPNQTFIDELKKSSARGVDVRLLLPGLTDSWITINSSRAHYQELLDSGVRIFERNDALQHAKTAVIDGIWSTVGSSNLDYRSFLHANEANVVIWGQDFAEKMEELFLKDQEMNREILLEEWHRRPFYKRMMEKFASLFDYWL